MPRLIHRAYRIKHCVGCAGTPSGLLHCHRCGRDKEPTMFYRNRKRGHDCFHDGCKTCRRREARDYSKRTYIPKALAA